MEQERRIAANARQDAWLGAGGRVVTASERAARAAVLEFHRRRRAEGLAAWPAPDIQDWQSFVRREWEARRTDDRLVLNPLQERALWAKILEKSADSRMLLEEPRRRVAELAADAHRLLCFYVRRFPTERDRSGWQQDAAAFSGWLRDFDSACRAEKLIGSGRLALDLPGLLEADAAPRPPLLLVGFDRILPVQRRVFDAWGRWSEQPAATRADEIHYYEAADPEAELEACALWCAQRLAADPEARLLVLVQNLAERRGEIERAFHRFGGGDGAAARFEFSLGVPLAEAALGRGALLTLRWLHEALEENEIDWLFSTGQGTDSGGEAIALSGFMGALRRHNLQRTRWTQEDFAAQRCGTELPQSWLTRNVQARRRLHEAIRRRQFPLEWAGLVPELLEAAGWPGGRALASAEFQVLRRWQQTLDACASLGFDGVRISWDEFLRELRRAAADALFAAESQDAPIQIAGPAEAAGLRADAIWFLGADEERWPANGATNPLLPIAVQRESGMPHSSPQLDLAVAQAITERVLASASAACFSYARHSEGVEARPSRLVVNCAGEPHSLPAGLVAPAVSAPATVVFEDASRVPLQSGNASGGSTVLTLQSQCPFKAFATARLGARGWEPAQAGLTAAQRGQLLHDVLHAVWAGPPDGVRTHEALVAVPDLGAFVERHVQRVFEQGLPAGVRACMPQRYLELEQIRLTGLIAEWLEYERGRAPFTVSGTEQEADIEIAGLKLHLRLDRIDRLHDGSVLVVDYKTGDVSTRWWETPRPEDVQLPLYALYALDREKQPLGGLIFARIKAGKCCFEGRIGDAKENLLPGLSAAAALVKTPLNLEEMDAWRGCIEGLARDFVAGRADVDPREYPRTCERCELHAVCRIQEFQPAPTESEEAADE